MKKSDYRISPELMLAMVMLLACLLFVARVQGEFLQYTFHQKDYRLQEAVVGQEQELGNKLERVIFIQTEDGQQKMTVPADRRDREGEKITVAVSKDGSVVRTAFLLPADSVFYVVCFSLLFFSVILALDAKTDFLGIRGAVHNSEMTEDDREHLRDMERTRILLRLAGPLLAWLAAMIVIALL